MEMGANKRVCEAVGLCPSIQNRTKNEKAGRNARSKVCPLCHTSFSRPQKLFLLAFDELHDLIGACSENPTLPRR